MTDYCYLLLGKKIYNLQEEDLVNFFKNEQEETNTLEFKSGKVEILKLCKEICAFLNTEGGLIIIGAPEEKTKTINKSKYNVCQGELTSSQFINKDWLYKKIYSRITPIPTNLKIQEIIGNKKKYFVIEVNQSQNPPHQLDAEGRYYIRIEREAKPAPHGIIQSLFDRRQKPKPNAFFYFKNINNYKLKTEIVITNDSKITAENINGYISIYGVRNIIIHDANKRNSITFKNKTFDIRISNLSYLIKGLTTSINIEIEHFKNPFLLQIVLWCKHSELYQNSIIYDPKENKVLTKHETGDEKERKYNELIKQVDDLKQFKNKKEPKIITGDCSFLTIYSKDNLDNIITVSNANCSQKFDYSQEYIQFTLNDDSGNFSNCFCEKTKIQMHQLNFYPAKTFIGSISNEPKMYSFVVHEIV